MLRRLVTNSFMCSTHSAATSSTCGTAVAASCNYYSSALLAKSITTAEAASAEADDRAETVAERMCHECSQCTGFTTSRDAITTTSSSSLNLRSLCKNQCCVSTCLHLSRRFKSVEAASELLQSNSTETLSPQTQKLKTTVANIQSNENVNNKFTHLQKSKRRVVKTVHTDMEEDVDRSSTDSDKESNLVGPSQFLNEGNDIKHKPIVNTSRVIIPPIPSLTEEEVVQLHSASEVALKTRKQRSRNAKTKDQSEAQVSKETSTSSSLSSSSNTRGFSDLVSENCTSDMAAERVVKTPRQRVSRGKRQESNEVNHTTITTTTKQMKRTNAKTAKQHSKNYETDNQASLKEQLPEKEEMEKETTPTPPFVLHANHNVNDKAVINLDTTEAFSIDDIPDMLSVEENSPVLHEQTLESSTQGSNTFTTSSEASKVNHVEQEEISHKELKLEPLINKLVTPPQSIPRVKTQRRKREPRHVASPAIPESNSNISISSSNSAAQITSDTSSVNEHDIENSNNNVNGTATVDKLKTKTINNKSKTTRHKLVKPKSGSHHITADNDDNYTIKEDISVNNKENNGEDNEKNSVEECNQEEFFAELMHKMKQEEDERNTSKFNSSLEESTLVYNALTGRMTSETSATVQSLIAIGFAVNEERQLHVGDATRLNAFANKIRSNSLTISPKWPSTLKKVLGNVLQNKNIDNPASAIEQLIQVKINTMLRSRYASVVSAEVNTVGTDLLSESSSSSSSETNPLSTYKEESQSQVEQYRDGGITLNKEQEHVIKIALQGHHMYIGGSAGTGKTVLLRVLCKRLQAHRLRVAMTATTGVAGCHISGSTFHHAFGVTSRGEFLRRGSLLEYDVIIIDEVSMFSQRLFEDFDKILREEAGTPDLPFGGIQIILCGDFLQLGCINESSLIHSSLFHSNFVKLRLHTQVRQTAHSKFAHDLQEMRLGRVPEDLTETVQQLPAGTMVQSAVNLLPTNKEVHAANEAELQRLSGDPLTLLPETGITSLKCDATATLLLRTRPEFNAHEFARHVRALLQATLDLPHASLLSLYKLYEDGHAMRVILPPSESLAWRDGMRERFLEIASLINDLDLGAVVTEIVPKGDGLHTPETEEYLQKLMSKHPVAQSLTFKKGCRVLLRANLTSNLVNGSIGTVVDFVECKIESFPKYLRSERVDECIERYRVFCLTECGMPVPLVPVVKFHSGEQVAVPPWEFSVGGLGNTHYYSLSCVALPLSLAYAFTVHKVQGLTLVGRVHLELSRMWPCDHLLYVAMSRVRNPEQLSMSSFSAKMVVANAECVAFDTQLKGADEMDNMTLAQYPVASWKKCNDTIFFLRRKGSSLRRLLEEVTRSGTGMSYSQRNYNPHGMNHNNNINTDNTNNNGYSNYSSNYMISSSSLQPMASLFQSSSANKARQAFYSTSASQNNNNEESQQEQTEEEYEREEQESCEYEEQQTESEEMEHYVNGKTRNHKKNGSDNRRRSNSSSLVMQNNKDSLRNNSYLKNVNSDNESRTETKLNENGNLFMLNSATPYHNAYDGEMEENEHIQLNSRDMALRKLAEMGINVDHILTVQRSSARWRQLRNLVKHATRVEKFKETRRRAKLMAENDNKAQTTITTTETMTCNDDSIVHVASTSESHNGVLSQE